MRCCGLQIEGRVRLWSAHGQLVWPAEALHSFERFNPLRDDLTGFKFFDPDVRTGGRTRAIQSIDATGLRAEYQFTFECLIVAVSWRVPS